MFQARPEPANGRNCACSAVEARQSSLQPLPTVSDVFRMSTRRPATRDGPGAESVQWQSSRNYPPRNCQDIFGRRPSSWRRSDLRVVGIGVEIEAVAHSPEDRWHRTCRRDPLPPPCRAGRPLRLRQPYAQYLIRLPRSAYARKEGARTSAFMARFEGNRTAVDAKKDGASDVFAQNA
jgi:hypothetical protein